MFRLEPSDAKEFEEFLKSFLNATINDDDPVSQNIKATISQIVYGVRIRLQAIAKENDGFVSQCDVIGAQIKELHRAIGSLHSCLTLIYQSTPTLQ